MTHVGSGEGPYDITALDDDTALADTHLDLGPVLLPVVEGGQVNVEMSADHLPQTVYLMTPIGRLNVDAFAAPRSGGLWREIVRELTESLRAEGAKVSVESGHWGREVVAVAVDGSVHRLIGVDGSRWMLRGVASGPAEHADDLATLLRAVLSETVVRRGDNPEPPRAALPLVLPQILAEQVAAAQQQMFTEQQQGFTEQQFNPGPAPVPQVETPPEPAPDSPAPSDPAPDPNAPLFDAGPPTNGSALSQLRNGRLER